MEKVDLKNFPLVSICIPAYNCEKYIKNTVESVLAQTYKNIEIIIVNDGSTDNTGLILKTLANKGVHIFNRGNAGAAAARNLAFSQSRGQFVKFLDGDDIISSGMIESQVKLAIVNEDCLISGQWGRFYNNDLLTFKLNEEECWQTLPVDQWLCSSWRNGSSMTQSGIFLIPRAIIEKAGNWDEELTLIDDFDFFTRIMLQSRMVVFDPGSILYYRSGNSGSLSDKNGRDAILSAFRSIDKATTNFIINYPHREAMLACANVWQHFIYIVYPRYPVLTRYAQNKVDEMGGSSLKFISGGVTKLIVPIVGWKISKKLKQLYNLLNF